MKGIYLSVHLFFLLSDSDEVFYLINTSKSLVAMTFPKRISIGSWKQPLKPETPKVITFDAYNTLYATTLPVMEQYSIVARKYNINIDPEQLKERFPAVFKALKKEHPSYGKYTNITAIEWWSLLIRNVFHPAEASNEMIDEILSRFEGEQAYKVYPDVLVFLKEVKLKHPHVVLGIISNTDPIVDILLKNLGLHDFFEDHIYLSYNLGVKKPSKEIFDRAIEDICSKVPGLLESSSLKDLKRRCWHCGDEATNDLHGAEQAGWNGVLIDRHNKYGYLSKSFEEVERSADLLSIDKIDSNCDASYKLSLKQTDTLFLKERACVVSNFETLKAMLL